MKLWYYQEEILYSILKGRLHGLPFSVISSKVIMNQLEQAEDRIISELGQEAEIAALIAPLLRDASYRLVRVKLSNLNNLTLQIMAERLDGNFTIDDCEKLHCLLAPVIEVETIISGDYNLEISSPGIDRPLVRKSDFINHIGYLIKLETIDIVNTRSKFKGFIEEASLTNFTLRPETTGDTASDAIELEYTNLKSASLILTKELVQETLAKDKKLKKQNKLATN